MILDTHGRTWSVHRVWWPFPGDLLDFTDVFEIVIGAFFVVLWPFWLLLKFVGVRWTVVIERDGHEVGRERVRGWRRSKRRVDEILREVAAGGRGGHVVL